MVEGANQPLVLLVDDDPSLQELLRYLLEQEEMHVAVASNAGEALRLIAQERPALILLDVMLPGTDGLTLLQLFRKRSETAHTPVLMLSARGQESDKVNGLDLGADDYITKPFSPRELTARVRAHLRRKAEWPQAVESGPIRMMPERFEVEINGHPESFTPKEFEILRTLVTHPGRVFTREELLSEVWGYAFYGDTRTVDVHIRHIRQKLEAIGEAGLLETVRGIGYKYAPSPSRSAADG